ncbi:MAG: BON domain-containing protein [Alphaproteobacteria bacterium]|nr:BON domain-containing protein [Alphaproteobacteria bacterium]
MKNAFRLSAVTGTMTAALLLFAVSGCTPVGVAAGAGATVGVAAAQEGGLKQATTDAAIRLQISDLWLKKSVDMYRRLSMTVTEGRVLITGSVPYPDMRVDAIRLAWQADGVRQVINEVRVDDGPGITGYMTDTWITGDIKTHLMFDKYVQSINYTIDTVGGTVYLMGVAQDQKELDRVLDYARNTKYVKNVVSYVRLRGETPPGMQTPTGAPDAAASTTVSGAPIPPVTQAPPPQSSYESGAVQQSNLP